jgi:hypothetical protein
MKVLAVKIVIVLILQFAPLITPEALAQEQTVPDSTIAALNDVWKGEWTNPIGHLYIAEMRLVVSKDGTIQGEILWTLKKSPRDNEQVKLGLTGVEFVSGKYDAASRVLTFSGYRKDDPDTILGLDQYKLLLAENEMVIGGITLNNGGWRGIFSLTRAIR